MKKKTIIILVLLALLAAAWFLLPDEPQQPEVPQNVEGELVIHFIDVGQADCILLEYGDYTLLIDGGNRDDGQLVVSYLEQQGIEELDAVVCTHAHEDHVGGLPSVLAVYPTGAVYAPTRTYASNVFDDFMYYADQQRLEVIIPQPGDTLHTGDLTITVMGPVESYAETNDTSIVLRVDFGETSFLFTGDMEVAAENDMLDYWGEDYDWQVDVLKVGHHCSDTSSGYCFLNETMPTHAVVSVGEDNSYGHPHKEPMERLEDAGCIIYRTDEMGTILAVSDGKEVTITWENQSSQPNNAEPGAEVQTTYIGNKNSQKFHAPGCDSLPKEENRVYFDSYSEAIEAGYSPCGGCIG